MATPRALLFEAQGLIDEALANLPPDEQPSPSRWVRPVDTGLRVPESELRPFPGGSLPAGAVVENRVIDAGLRVSAENVTLRNCLIKGSSETPAVWARARGLNLEHCEITGSFPAAVGYDHYRAYRCVVHHFSADAFKLGSGAHVVECWVHDAQPASGAHADAVQQEALIAEASSVERCFLDMGPALGNSVLFLCPSLGGRGGGDVVIEDNFLAGGNYSLQVRDGDWGKYHQLTYQIRRNVIKDGAWRYGAVVKDDTIAEWTDNALSTGTAV